MDIHISLYIYMYMYMYMYILFVSSHNLKSRVSKPRTVAYVHTNIPLDNFKSPIGWAQFSRLFF